MDKQTLISDSLARLTQIGVTYSQGQGTDVLINCEFLDAAWGTGNKKINYEASVLFDETSQTVFMWELTKESGSGFSFGGDSSTSFQSGATLFRKVKSIQYGPDGKAYEYALDLGAIPKTFKDTVKQYGWKFKTVLSKAKASYPPGYVSSNFRPQPQPQPQPQQPQAHVPQPQAYQQPQPQAYVPQPQSQPQAYQQPQPQAYVPQPQAFQQPPQPYSNPQGQFYAQAKSPAENAVNRKSSVLNTILFWSAWVILSLLCLLMLSDRFSAVRLIGFAAVIAAPIILKKKLFSKVFQSLLWWLIAFVVFILIIALS